MSLTSRVAALTTEIAQQIRAIHAQVGNRTTDPNVLIDAYTSYPPATAWGQKINGMAYVAFSYNSIPNGAGVGVLRIGWRPATTVPLFSNREGVAGFISTGGVVTIRGTGEPPTFVMAVFPVA